jgi:nitroreductase
MPSLDLSPDELLTTTRAVRKRLDLERPVDLALVRECVEIALQGPTGSNAQGWHFVVVTDAERRAAIADLYLSAWNAYKDSSAFSAFSVHEGDPSMEAVQHRMVGSVQYLAENLARVPVHVIPCVEGRVESTPPPIAVLTQATAYGSILPATWSFMLAARARGLGTAWTTIHLMHEKKTAEILGIPHDEVTQVALIPVAHTIGTEFKTGPRKSLDGILHVEGW